jgi:hypothetical protein
MIFILKYIWKLFFLKIIEIGTKFVDLLICVPFNINDFLPKKIAKKIKIKIKFDVQKYFNIKIMFDGLDQSFGLSNSKYGPETREILYFTKYHNLTVHIYIYIYIYMSGDTVSLTQKTYQIISKF